MHRKLLKPSFNMITLGKLFPIFNEIATILRNKLDEQVGAGDFVISKILIRCTLDMVCG